MTIDLGTTLLYWGGLAMQSAVILIAAASVVNFVSKWENADETAHPVTGVLLALITVMIALAIFGRL